MIGWAALAVPVAIFLAGRWVVIGDVVATEEMRTLVLLNPLLGEGTPVLRQVATGTLILGMHWWVFVWPARLAADHSWPQIPPPEDFGDPRAALALLTLLALLAVAVLSVRRRPVITLSLGAWLITASLTANLLFPVGVLYAERLLYLPSAWMCLLVGAVAAEALRFRQRWVTRLIIGLSVTALLAAGIRTVRQAWVWGEPLRLAAHDIRAVPRACNAWFMYGYELRRAGQREEARRAFKRSLELSRASPDADAPPLHPKALRHLSRLLTEMVADAERRGQPIRATQRRRELDEVLTHAVAQLPDDPEVLGLLALRLVERGDLAEAGEVLEDALAADGSDVAVLCALGAHLRASGRVEEAVTILERAVVLEPQALRARELLLGALLDAGDEEGVEHQHREIEKLLEGTQGAPPPVP